MSAQHALRRPSLRLVETDAHGSIWFCGRCGERHAEPMSAPVARVCPACELGLLLQTSSATAPGPEDAFLIVDSSLTVQAVSARAEASLGVLEGQAINRHVTELLITGDTEPTATGGLAAAITRAAGGDHEAKDRFAVRPSHTFGVRMLARIAACGPPPAALLVLDQPGF
jgi:hypothetical protein